MAAPDFLDAIRFTAGAGGTADFTSGGAVQGYRDIAGNGVNGNSYRYRAESADLAQWEIGTGTWNGTTLTRTVLLSSSGSKINFTVAPQVSLTFQAQDVKTTQAQNDNSTNLATTQYADRIRNLPGHGRFLYNSATQVKLIPFGGYRVPLAGVIYDLPSAGITRGNTGVYVNGVAAQNLAASTFYWVYVWNNGGSPELDFCTTGHTTDTASFNIGVEIKSGDNSRTLVGCLYANGSSQFFDDGLANFGVASWFNRRLRGIKGTSTGGATTSTTTGFGELNTASRLQFVSFGDEGLVANCGGPAQNTVAGNTCFLNIGLDGTATQAAFTSWCTVAYASVNHAAVTLGGANPPEGYHYLTPMGFVNGGTGTFSVSLWGSLRT